MRIRSFARLAFLAPAFFCFPLAGLAQFEDMGRVIEAELRANLQQAEARPGAPALVELKLRPNTMGEDYILVGLTQTSAVVRLVLPSGAEVTQHDLGKSGYRWESLTGPTISELPAEWKGSVVVYEIALPSRQPAGVYGVKVEVPPGAKAIEVRVSHFGLGLGVEGEDYEVVGDSAKADREFYQLGDTVVISVPVLEDGRPVRGATVTAEVVPQEGAQAGRRVATLTMSDTRGDGRYSATFIPKDALRYAVTVTIAGRKRRESCGFFVIPAYARLLSVTDRSEDQDKNGLIDRVLISPKLDVKVAGDYNTQVHITGTNGQTTWQQVRRHLDPGIVDVPVAFDSKELFRMGVGGPFEVALVVLTRRGAGEEELAGSWEHVGKTAAYKRSLFDRGAFYLDEHMQITAVPGAAGFESLRVNIGVFSPGGECQCWTGLHGKGFDYLAEAGESRTLPKGKATVQLDIPGASIARAKKDGPWDVKLSVSCGELPPVSLTQTSAVFKAAQFADRPDDFQLVLSPARVHIAQGEQVQIQVRIQPIGAFDEQVTLDARGVPAGVDSVFQSSAHPGNPGDLELKAGPEAWSGTYMVKITGESGALRREAVLTVEVKGREKKAESARTDSIKAAFNALGARSAAGVKRRANVVMVLHRGGTGNAEQCATVREAGSQAAGVFRQGRDAVGGIFYSASAYWPLPLSRDFDPSRLAHGDVMCSGPTNLPRALAAAYQALSRLNDRAAVNAVVLFTDNVPEGLDAAWPIKTQADRRRCPGQKDECASPPSKCAGAKPASFFAAPFGAMAMLFTIDDASPVTEWALPPAGCSRYFLMQDVAYIPDTDASGTPVAGKKPLVRFNGGPYAGKIRPDLSENVLNAAQNVAERLARTARDSATLPITTYVVALHSQPDTAPFFASIANDPAAENFDKRAPAGLVVHVGAVPEIRDGFLKVTEAIVARMERTEN